jgi:hypothetical protein
MKLVIANGRVGLCVDVKQSRTLRLVFLMQRGIASSQCACFASTRNDVEIFMYVSKTINIIRFTLIYVLCPTKHSAKRT